jgi:polysaccharide biosynthesis transport protein
LQRQIEALSAQAAADPGPGKVVPNNPDYIAVQGQLEAATREIAALRADAARERQRLHELESGVASAPRVESEYAVLMRERGALQAQFDDLQKRLREADISQNLETEQRGDRFTQIRTPTVADLPHYPNRIGIFLLGIILGAGLAVGLAALRESSDPTVRSSRDLAEITTVPAIASIPVMLGEGDRQKQRIWRVTYAGVLTFATVVVVMTALAR